jgi:hypothetical protein
MDIHHLRKAIMKSVNKIKFLLKLITKIEMEVATIHSIKGETHAATLVVETTFGRSYDISNVFTYVHQQHSYTTKPQTLSS